MLIETLQAQSGLSRSQLLHLSETASRRYKVYTIPKKRGGRRRIEHPSRALKAIQRWLCTVLFSRLPVHTCATAYRKGANIRMNALVHADSTLTMRMDFRSFFPSFRAEHIEGFLTQHEIIRSMELSDDDLRFVCSVSTRNGRLTIGAPSSPTITNAIMYGFDEDVCELTRERGLVYTRYADDLFISSYEMDRLKGVFKEVAALVRGFEYANLRVNRQKTAYLSRRRKRSITGLVITPEGSISLGRARKREIKALVHREVSGALEQTSRDRLRGLLAFSWDVEPRFIDALCRKYGRASVERIMGKE